MNILCSICRDLFTGTDNEVIYSTSCGHVFHYPCLLQWTERTQNCPHCRTEVSKNSMFRLNLYYEGAASPRTGVEDYQQRNLSFELSMKNIELEQLKEISRTASHQSKGLRLQVKNLEEELKVVKSRECTVLQENRNLKAKLVSERQKRQRVGEVNQENIPLDVIDLDDFDPELYEDIDENLRTMRREVSDRDPDEVIVLDDSISQHNHPEVEELKNQIELKEALLASAVARISELEDENLLWKLNGADGANNVQFP